ncbi:MAG: 1-acyl-sn-glycerol-3-phosphate acyltransferase, partial [Alphaproteobacteria bacterium]|nr:1-acyl-sn-glycerol-3-phosphate acyltransferase [Alphaproteobacteria bacterium]
MKNKRNFKIFGCNDMFSFEKKQRFLKRLLTFLFGIKVEGLENLKKAGKKVLIIPNHTSYLDGLLIALFVNKKITFSVTDRLADKWWIKFFTSLMDSRFLNPDNPLSIKTMVNELNNEKTCMIFTLA